MNNIVTVSMFMLQFGREHVLYRCKCTCNAQVERLGCDSIKRYINIFQTGSDIRKDIKIMKHREHSSSSKCSSVRNIGVFIFYVWVKNLLNGCFWIHICGTLYSILNLYCNWSLHSRVPLLQSGQIMQCVNPEPKLLQIGLYLYWLKIVFNNKQGLLCA